MSEEFLDIQSRQDLGLGKLWLRIKSEWLGRFPDNQGLPDVVYGISRPVKKQTTGGNTEVKIKTGFNNFKLKPGEEGLDKTRLMDRSEYSFRYNRIVATHFDANGILHNRPTNDTQRNIVLSSSDFKNINTNVKRRILTRLDIPENKLELVETNLDSATKTITFRFVDIPDNHYLIDPSETVTFTYARQRSFSAALVRFADAYEYPENLFLYEELKKHPPVYPIGYNRESNTYIYPETTSKFKISYRRRIEGQSGWYGIPVTNNFSDYLRFMKRRRPYGGKPEDDILALLGSRWGEELLIPFYEEHGLEHSRNSLDYKSYFGWHHFFVGGTRRERYYPGVWIKHIADKFEVYNRNPEYVVTPNKIMTDKVTSPYGYRGLFLGYKEHALEHYMFQDQIDQQDWLEQTQRHITEETALMFDDFIINEQLPLDEQFFQAYPVPFPGVDNAWIWLYFGTFDLIKRVSLDDTYDKVLYRARPIHFHDYYLEGHSDEVEPLLKCYHRHVWMDRRAVNYNTPLPSGIKGFMFWLRKKKQS